MEENIYQNIDLINNNPLKPETKTELTLKQKLKTDRKIQALVGLAGFTVFILLVSIIASIFIKPSKNGNINSVLPTPIATPTLVNDANILPPQYQSQFDNIDAKLKYNPEIMPPQIDLNLGN